jgi:hypothetical protein
VIAFNFIEFANKFVNAELPGLVEAQIPRIREYNPGIETTSYERTRWVIGN